MSLLYRNLSIDLLCKSMDWFLYDSDLSHERINYSKGQYMKKVSKSTPLESETVVLN